MPRVQMSYAEENGSSAAAQHTLQSFPLVCGCFSHRRFAARRSAVALAGTVLPPLSCALLWPNGQILGPHLWEHCTQGQTFPTIYPNLQFSGENR